jgi:aryl-alcohol dehydrogenase-like predicted oxidoreductase
MILGLGTIGIGREWGYRDPRVPSDAVARKVLERAVECGYRFFDTAPSYGWSEERLGHFLSTLPRDLRAELTIATKFGEFWDFDRREPFVDHSFDALRRSLDRSLQLLGRVDVVQLHKTNPAAIRSDDVHRAWEYARSMGVGYAGASVSDTESAEYAVADGGCVVIQAPFNRETTQFGQFLEQAAALGKLVVTNRPFAMGRLLYGDNAATQQDAFAFVLSRRFRGVVLTGSKNADHVVANMEAFQAVRARSASTEPPGELFPR